MTDSFDIEGTVIKGKDLNQVCGEADFGIVTSDGQKFRIYKQDGDLKSSFNDTSLIGKKIGLTVVGSENPTCKALTCACMVNAISYRSYQVINSDSIQNEVMPSNDELISRKPLELYLTEEECIPNSFA